MCRELLRSSIPGFHFYTLNLEKSVLGVVKELGICDLTALRKAFPWSGSRVNIKGLAEEVRPINWANRPKSYIERTASWDEYPNGRWGDSRSPAFGDLSTTHSFFRASLGTKEERLSMWGQSPITSSEIGEVFAKYIEGKIPILPWCESSLQVIMKCQLVIVSLFTLIY
jgi:methylenetetrahydrofolate reductase (NADPH)